MRTATQRGDGAVALQRWGGPYLHGLGMAETPVVRYTAPVVVADEAALRPRTASVTSHRAEGRAAPTELRCLLEHKLVLHVPEATGPKIDLDILLLDRVGW